MRLTKDTLRERRRRLGLSQAKLAEATKIPQHMLSAAELGKSDLTAEYAARVEAVFSDASTIRNLATRPKRYRRHVYAAVRRDENRVRSATRSLGNSDYLDVLADLASGVSQKPTNGLRVLSLFAGCGGLSYGFRSAGFEVAAFVEIESGLREIYSCNLPAAVELPGDITSYTEAEVQSVGARVGPVDVIVGGPPCQGFSLAGKRAVSDPRNRLFHDYMRFVRHFRPRAAVIENVRLLTSMRNSVGELVAEEVSHEFDKAGYRARLFLVNAKDHGVPQHRERAFFVAVRKDLQVAPTFPAVAFVDPIASLGIFPPWRTFADGCSDLPYIESGESSDVPLHQAVKHPEHVVTWLWDVTQGHSAHENADPTLRPPSGYNTTYKRQIWNEPAATVQTTFGMISGCRNVHPIATRSLTVREAARIQSFPDSFALPGKLGVVRTAIGNAVPPLLSKAIASELSVLLG